MLHSYLELKVGLRNSLQIDGSQGRGTILFNTFFSWLTCYTTFYKREKSFVSPSVMQFTVNFQNGYYQKQSVVALGIHQQITKNIIVYSETGEMAHCFRACISLAENLSLIPRTHIIHIINACSSSYRASNTLFWSPWLHAL